VDFKANGNSFWISPKNMLDLGETSRPFLREIERGDYPQLPIVTSNSKTSQAQLTRFLLYNGVFKTIGGNLSYLHSQNLVDVHIWNSDVANQASN